MKKTYQLEDLGCANCAAKMERKIQELPQVRSGSVNFMTQKLVVDIEEGQEEPTLKQIQKIIRRIEPDCTIKK